MNETPMNERERIRSTTVLAIRRDNKLVMAGDGQVSIGDTAFKHKAVKLRRMRDNNVIAGYAGSAADALALFERLEAKLDEYSGNLPKACVQLVKQWRTDEVLRQLEAVLVVGDRDHLLLVTGTGDLLTPDNEIIGIGSGGGYARAAAMALLAHTKMPLEKVVEEAMRITADICVWTNDSITVEVLE